MDQLNINPEKNYGMGEAAILCGKDRKTIRRYCQKFPDKLNVIFSELNGRMLLSGETILKLRNNQITFSL